MFEPSVKRGLWSGRSRGRLVTAVALAALVVSACTTGPGGSQTLGSVKREYYGNHAQTQANLIAVGQAQPVVEFTVQNSPPSVFWNYPIPDAQAGAFESFIGLPHGFSLAKVRILDSDPAPRYWLSLNIYRVTGITTGLRAEWNTYVDDGTGVPRFMIIRARAAEGSIDPIGPLAKPEPFTHSLDPGDVITTALNKTVIQDGTPVVTPDNQFSSTISLPDPADRDFVAPTLEWTGANDFIYWMNGVNDRILYNSNVHNASMISVDPADVTIANDSEFAPYLEPNPQHVLVYLNKLEFAIGPWWNVTEPDGRVEEGERLSLLSFKNSLYGGQANQNALLVQTGNAQPAVRTAIEGTPPGAYWHWKVPGGNLAAFETALNLPAYLSLAPIRLENDDASAEHWLTLNVYPVEGSETGLRAEWSTYVDDGSSIKMITVETRADHRAPDAVSLFTDPYPISHTEGATLDTTVGSGATAFTSSFSVPPAGPGTSIVASTEWVGSNDISLWPNGIADRTYYDTSFFRKLDVDPATVTVSDGSQWAAFVGPTPDRVWVNEGSFDTVVNPWLGV
jgi:hypothetical protein